jgi:hypothetical protein
VHPTQLNMQKHENLNRTLQLTNMYEEEEE